jgi:hypothetical protein
MEILLVLFTVMALAMLAAVGSIALLHWSLRRHNRVSPATPTRAPVVWLVSPTRPARAHRRLRTAATAARSIPHRPDAPTRSRATLSRDLERQAVALDEWVVWTAGAPSRWRRDHYRAIDVQLRQLESLVMRLAAIEDTEPRVRVDDTARALDDAAELVEQLEQAHAEVLALERLATGDDIPVPGLPYPGVRAEARTHPPPPQA